MDLGSTFALIAEGPSMAAARGLQLLRAARCVTLKRVMRVNPGEDEFLKHLNSMRDIDSMQPVPSELLHSLRKVSAADLAVDPEWRFAPGGGGGCLLESAETSETLWDDRRRELHNNSVLLRANDIALLMGAPLPLRPPPSLPPSSPPSPPPPLILPAAAETTALPAAASVDARVLQLIIDGMERMQADESQDHDQRALDFAQHVANGIPDISSAPSRRTSVGGGC